jgi:hypothetical protein
MSQIKLRQCQTRLTVPRSLICTRTKTGLEQGAEDLSAGVSQQAGRCRICIQPFFGYVLLIYTFIQRTLNRKESVLTIEVLGLQGIGLEVSDSLNLQRQW